MRLQAHLPEGGLGHSEGTRTHREASPSLSGQVGLGASLRCPVRSEWLTMPC